MLIMIINRSCVRPAPEPNLSSSLTRINLTAEQQQQQQQQHYEIFWFKARSCISSLDSSTCMSTAVTQHRAAVRSRVVRVHVRNCTYSVRRKQRDSAALFQVGNPALDSTSLKGRLKLLLAVRGVPCVRPISHRLRASAAATLERFPAVALLLFICGRRAGGAAGDFLAVQSNRGSVATTRISFHIGIALTAAGCSRDQTHDPQIR